MRFHRIELPLTQTSSIILGLQNKERLDIVLAFDVRTPMCQESMGHKRHMTKDEKQNKFSQFQASKGRPGGLPNNKPNYLAIEDLSPILDYVVATQFRGERIGWELNMKLTKRL